MRQRWRRAARPIDRDRFVFVDESGANTSMTRTRARAVRGRRAVGAVPNGHWKTLTLLGAVRRKGMLAAATIAAPTDAEVFRTFVRDALVPALRPRDVVVWDNLSAHQASGVIEMIQSAGASVLPLPPYSPDFSPIEPCWSKIKQHLRTAQARTPEALGAAATHAFSTVTPQDARGWFENCGLLTVA